MKSTHAKNIKQRLIESYMRELRFNIVGSGSGLANAVLFESPSNNSLLRTKMSEIEEMYAQENESKLVRRMK